MSGSAQNLATALSVASRPIVWLSIQAFGTNAALAYVGGAGVSAANYGFRIEIPVSTVPSAPCIVELPQGPMDLDGFYVIGTNTEKLSVAWVDK